MKKMLTLAAMLLFGIGLWAQATPATPATPPGKKPTIRQRQRTQQKRVGQGIASGQLTAREGARLERKEARLTRQIARDRASGGKLTAGERRSINRRQNRLSRQIYRQKHDAQRRK
jgi:hypothetical protein